MNFFELLNHEEPTFTGSGEYSQLIDTTDKAMPPISLTKEDLLEQREMHQASIDHFERQQSAFPDKPGDNQTSIDYYRKQLADTERLLTDIDHDAKSLS